MGNEARSAVGFRWMIRALLGLTDPEDGDSLRNMNTAVLPNGATCYVLENSSVYRFRRNVAGTPSGEDIVQPLSGDGLWFRVAVDDVLNESGALVTVGTNFIIPTVNDNAWHEPGTTPPFVLSTAVSGSQWSLGTLGQLEYTGRGGTFLVQAGWSCTGAADAAGNNYSVGISLNGDLNGTAAPTTAGIQRQFVPQSALFSVSTTRVVVLSDGDILQPRARVSIGTAISNLSVDFLSWAVVPMPSI